MAAIWRITAVNNLKFMSCNFPNDTSMWNYHVSHKGHIAFTSQHGVTCTVHFTSRSYLHSTFRISELLAQYISHLGVTCTVHFAIRNYLHSTFRISELLAQYIPQLGVTWTVHFASRSYLHSTFRSSELLAQYIPQLGVTCTVHSAAPDLLEDDSRSFATLRLSAQRCSPVPATCFFLIYFRLLHRYFIVICPTSSLRFVFFAIIFLFTPFLLPFPFSVFICYTVLHRLSLHPIYHTLCNNNSCLNSPTNFSRFSFIITPVHSTECYKCYWRYRIKRMRRLRHMARMGEKKCIQSFGGNVGRGRGACWEA